MSSIVDALFKLIKTLNAIKIPYMLVGGFAVNYYGAPRATGDIDISLLVGHENIDVLLASLKKSKFSFYPDEIKMLIKISNHFLMFDPSNTYRIDCWIPKTNFEMQALRRRKKINFAGKSIYLPAVEDLILFKLIAGRSKDDEDLKWIIKRQKGKLDKKYLKFWSMALSVNRELNKFTKI
ncbi:MAG: hypothetical protein QME05_05495 [Candidatus Margulisbacteria bacterium]|nr:hypothetical protein [Candidatus Margulisiibacteriota bacterium]